MNTLSFHLIFHTPAFLGDAQQNGRWRTPPFKAQLRQWWRVVYAAKHNYSVSVSDMRREEGLLFGNAWLEGDFRKSLVRLRLDRWDEGSLRKNQWLADSSVTHPEVTNRQVGSALYLGYGPLAYQKSTTLKANAAIQAGETATLSLAVPEKHADLITQALMLMHHYGTVGGRSRNGWGSYTLKPLKETPTFKGLTPLRDWRACLDLDWPHAIGKDENGALIWQTSPHDDWRDLMKTLAILKIGLRTQFVFTHGRVVGTPEERHWLSYPVTNHEVRDWNQLRLPNSLRFKVRKTADGKLVGVVFHMPHLPPAAFGPKRQVIEAVWQQVHQLLDHLKLDPSKRTYLMIPEVAPVLRRGALRTGLDTITLNRSPE
ncbi:MAG: hypothetical protein N2Z69_07310 [Methylophilaceae bacterium]|nr:hypothetical protein [Methylophilaceae bacterium]